MLDLRALGLLIGLLATTGAYAQDTPAVEPEPEPVAAPARPPIDPASIPLEGARLDETLREIHARSAAPRGVVSIADTLPTEEAQIAEGVSLTRVRLGEPGAAAEIRDARATWSRKLDRLQRHRAIVEAHAERLAADRATLEQLHARWTEARDALGADAPQTIARRATEAVGAIEAAQAELATRERDALDLVVRLAALEDSSGAVSEELEDALRARLFVRDSPPLWSAVRRASNPPVSFQAALITGVRTRFGQVRGYVESETVRVVLQVLVFLLATAILYRVRSLPADRRPVRDDRSWHTMLELPFSSALVLALGAGVILHARAPSAFLDVLVAVAVIPLARVAMRLVPGATGTALYMLIGLYVANRFVPLLAGAEPAFRLVLFAVHAAAVAAAVWVGRRLASRAADPAHDPLRIPRWIAHGGTVTLSLALLANVFGFVSLAALIADATIEALYVAVVLWQTVVLLGGAVRLSLTLPSAQKLGMVRHNAPLIEDRATRWFQVLGTLSWVAYVLFLFSLVDPIVRGARTLFGSSVTIGNLELSLGSLLALGAGAWISVWLSRGIRFVLDEDVLPRLSLPKGVPSTVSKLTNYVILTVGFMAALSAAGVETSQFAFLAGALGVGIGFGLQTIVNNFVSGLILLFERPIQEGDVIEVGGLTGTVVHIGIRACRVRTFDGAEVIVPNASLIANQVVNWTLSDRVRRFELLVGVAYGAHPEQVLALLTEVARGTPGILPNPPPLVVFDGFGASSKDFKIRAWAPYDEYGAIRSELAMRVDKALGDAGLEIPYPQQDLHLRSIAPEAAAALRPSGRVAAVDDEGLPGDPGRVVAGQEQHGGSHVVGEPDPT